jgi:hypothetical protein
MKDTIRPNRQEPQRLEDAPVSVRIKLSALWVSAMFLYVYVDIFALFKPGTIDDILAGRVFEFDISQAWAFGALALMTIPSLMVFLSLTLAARAARWTNVMVASVFVLVSIGNSVGETWAFYWFGSAIEAMLLLLIIRYAWTWPPLLASRRAEGAGQPGDRTFTTRSLGT